MGTDGEEKGFLRQRMFFVVLFVFVAFWLGVLWFVVNGAH